MADYDVVLLIEQQLTAQDAAQVRSLHEDIEDPVLYHLLVPVEEVTPPVETGISALGSGDVMAGLPLVVDPEQMEELRNDLVDDANSVLSASIAALTTAGGRGVGDIVSTEPIAALAAKVAAVDAREAIILTRPHVVAEFFHVDWTSRARRKLGVPVLHLLEHENFDEQAGEGEGISGF
ncbi:MAG: hypothetical protein JWP74_285 [Marmoricola sp.]|nr:hypothetical protein [Marmoricola sp.]